MKTATQNLENDHVHILRLTDVMQSMIRQKSSQLNDFDTVVSLIKNYADGLHHAKEENLLFPAMIEKGFSAEQGPIAVMLQEHVTGRAFVKGMSEAIRSIREDLDTSFQALYANMQGYIDLLKNHITKENNVLFRMADNLLTEKDQGDLQLAFEKIESHENGNLPEKYKKEIERLEKIYSI